jgi:RNA polymerase sigma-70 factor (ECF subfamily)
MTDIASVPRSPTVGPIPATDLEAAFESYRARLYRHALAVTRDAGAAEDLVQEAFLRLWRESRKGCLPENVGGWLATVATNLAMSRFRHEAVARRWIQETAHSTWSRSAPRHGRAENEYLQREEFDEVSRLLRTLPPDSRTVLVMAAHGYSSVEMARHLGRSSCATRALLCRARRTLRERIEGASADRDLEHADAASRAGIALRNPVVRRLGGDAGVAA